MGYAEDSSAIPSIKSFLGGNHPSLKKIEPNYDLEKLLIKHTA
jgi:hypothetical protein